MHRGEAFIYGISKATSGDEDTKQPSPSEIVKIDDIGGTNGGVV
jgi:hypothetical protein